MSGALARNGMAPKGKGGKGLTGRGGAAAGTTGGTGSLVARAWGGSAAIGAFVGAMGRGIVADRNRRS